MTEGPSGTGEGDWLVDASALSGDALARVSDPRRPDRLAWNTLRTLALWERDVWVPSLLEVACGNDNRLSPLEWTGASVVPWAAGTDLADVTDAVLDGPDAYVVLACTLVPRPSDQSLRAAVVAALDGSLQGGREAGLVVVAPPGSDGLFADLDAAASIALHDGRSAREHLEGAMGWVSWPELGRLALDLAEESDPNPAEQVRRLVAELQARFPEAVV